MDDIMKDKRFAHIAKDPRFKSIPRSQRRVKIDKRFQAMFRDNRFKVKYTVDKRGRPTTGTSNEDLKRFYDLSSSDSSDAEAEDNAEPTSVSKQGSPEHSDDSSADESSHGGENERNIQRSDDEIITEKLKSKLMDLSVDYARGEGEILSDSSSDEELSENDDENAIEHEWGELDKEAETTDTITHRLAVCNMDWDRIRAVDLMVLFNSFTPPGGLICSVTIYPSQFGLERMKKEDEEGPPELVRKDEKMITGKVSEVDSISDEGSEAGVITEDVNVVDETAEEGTSYQMEKLRKYQLNRLKYYYAIVECDSPSTANHIYNECDGMEYESSATRLDLRFVPEDTSFDEDPRERCTEMPDSSKYRPRLFTTTALQQGKVDLTWDETDPKRTEVTERLMAGDTVDDNDLKAYLASSSEDEGDHKQPGNCSKKQTAKDENLKGVTEVASDDSISDDDSISKYRNLLAGITDETQKKKNEDVHMEISWDLGLKEKTEEAVKKHISSLQERTPFQEMMDKRKEKRKQKRELRKLASTESDNERNLFSDDEIPSDIDLNDPFFTDELKHKSKSKRNQSKGELTEENDEERTKKAQLELLLMDENSSKHFNFKKIQSEEGDNISAKKKKRLKKKKLASESKVEDDNFKVNVHDSRFSSLFSSHLFNIDPTDPHFKRSRGMEEIISAKQKRFLKQPDGGISEASESVPKRMKKDQELSSLVKSIKHKTRNLKK